MKNIISLLFFVLFATTIKAQPFIPFPTNGAIWVNTEYTYTFNPPNPIPLSELTDVEYYCTTGLDTIIQSNTYTKVFYCGDAYKGAIRQDNGVVYFVPRDYTNEYLLYDFGAQQNQILEDVYVGNHFDETFVLQDFTVNQISTELIGGVNRRVVYADNYRWIEGIGCETGLFMEPWTNVSMYENRLECMSINGMTLYPTLGNGDCSFVVGLASENEIQFSAYPNPSSGNTTLQFHAFQAQAHINIYNTLGQKTETFVALNTDKVELTMNGMSGIYTVEITTEDGLRSNFKLVKN
ncbi:MAG: T9SS type A sorting domain-containing protein [Flavobacteriales bacterium]|nr:T9SS type A sorting domain-containing protein [Flavobacteriales bacterium]